MEYAQQSESIDPTVEALDHQDIVVPEYFELGASSLPGVHAVGVDPEFDVDDFARISAEVAKHVQVRKDQGSPDWPAVAQLARGVLEKHSKDLRIAMWMATALAAIEGWSGLAKGLSVAIGLTKSHGDGLYPQRKPRQINAIRQSIDVALIGRKQLADGSVHYSGVLMLYARGGSTLPQGAAESASRVRLQCRWLKARFPDAADRLTELERQAEGALERARPTAAESQAEQAGSAASANPISAVASNSAARSEAPEARATDADPTNALLQRPDRQMDAPAAEPSPNQAVTTVAQPTATTNATQPRNNSPSATTLSQGAPSNSREARELFRDVQRALGMLSGYRRRANLADARAYREARAALWLEIEGLPDDGALRAPEMEPLATQLRAAFDQGRFAEVVELAESNITRQTIFWLDLDRYAAEALEALGHTDAARAISADVALRMTEFPGLEARCFEGNVAFADAATKAWISRTGYSVATSNSGEVGSKTALTVSMPARDSALLARAEQLRDQAQDAESGMMLLRDAYRVALGGRDRLLARLDLARYCLDSGLGAIARHHVDALHAAVIEHGLDDWEPEIALRAEVLRYAVARMPASYRSDEEREAVLTDALRRIGLLDPVIAVQCAAAG